MATLAIVAQTPVLARRSVYRGHAKRTEAAIADDRHTYGWNRAIGVDDARHFPHVTQLGVLITNERATTVAAPTIGSRIG